MSLKKLCTPLFLSTCILATNPAFSAAIDKKRSGKTGASEVTADLCKQNANGAEKGLAAGVAVTAVTTILINESIEGFLKFNKKKLRKQTHNYGSLINFKNKDDLCIKITRKFTDDTKNGDLKEKITSEFSFKISKSQKSKTYFIRPISLSVYYAGAETEKNKGISLDAIIRISQLNEDNEIKILAERKFEFKDVKLGEDKQEIKASPNESAIIPSIDKAWPGTVTIVITEKGSKIKKLENRIEFLERNRETVQNLLQSLAGSFILGASN